MTVTSVQRKQAHVMYVLTCQHVVMSAPNLVNTHTLRIWCPEHHKESKITGVHKYEWRVFCHECTYARWTGTSEMLAKQMANAHYRARNHRGVTVEYAINPSAVEELVRLRRANAIDV